MAVTFRALVYAHQLRKDGTYNIKVRITYKGVSRHIPTNYYATPKQLTRGLNLKDANLIASCETLLAELRGRVAKIPPLALNEMSVDDVVRFIRRDVEREEFRLDYFQFGDKVAGSKSENTAIVYRNALSIFARFLGRRELDVNEVTATMLREFVEWNEERGNKSTKMYLTTLSAVYNEAKRRYNDEDSGIIRIPRNPFGAVRCKEARHEGQRALPLEVLQEMIDDEDCGRSQRVALDAFLLSFALLGANLADLYKAEGFGGDVWIYGRKKTEKRRADGARMEVRIPDEVMPVVERMRGRNERWLCLAEMFSTQRSATNAVNYHLEQWARRKGVEPFTFYAARKTFATTARNLGYDKATIDECLCHVGDYRLADIYIERDYRRMWAVANSVTATLDWNGEK